MRKSLWMVVLQLIRRNAWLRQYYERLRAAGKPGKVAVIAAMRKLLVAVWTVATHRKPFVPIHWKTHNRHEGAQNYCEAAFSRVTPT